jgi:di/tripeptidase
MEGPKGSVAHLALGNAGTRNSAGMKILMARYGGAIAHVDTINYADMPDPLLLADSQAQAVANSIGAGPLKLMTQLDPPNIELRRQESQAHFERIFDEARAEGRDLRVTLLGERPCMGKVDLDAIAHLVDVCGGIIKETVGIEELRQHSSSTDCNIPLSLGIPALCIGVYEGGGAHTREEWVKRASVLVGLEVGIKVVLALTCED